MKKYNIGGSRNVCINKNGSVTIEDSSTLKSAAFTAKRFVQFLSYVDNIDEAVTQLLMNQDVKLCTHIGGGWYISVTSGFLCVDFRQFYFNPFQGERPTKTGIALRIVEWFTMKGLIPLMLQNHPILTTTTTCASQPDHANQEGGLSCIECNPFAMLAEMHNSLHEQLSVA
jgi:hypothetical protein